MLDELLSAAGRGVGVTTTKKNTWRQFCGLPEMSLSSRKGTPHGDIHGEMLEMLEQIYRRPPIVSLIWLSLCLRGSNQIKALSLTAIALDNDNAIATKVQDECDIDESDILLGGYRSSNGRLFDPGQCLLECSNVDDLISFVCQLVLNGRSKDLRSIASNMTRKLAAQLSPANKKRLFACLIEGPFYEIGTLGNAANTFCDLLRLFVESMGSELDFSHVSKTIATSFINQMTTLHHYCVQNQGLFGKTECDGGFGCDLSNCVSCHNQIPPKKASKSSNKKSESTSYEPNNPNLLPEQVRPFQRGRLEASTAATVSSEFSSYNQLKFRVALSQVHVSVSDPRYV